MTYDFFLKSARQRRTSTTGRVQARIRFISNCRRARCRLLDGIYCIKLCRVCYTRRSFVFCEHVYSGVWSMTYGLASTDWHTGVSSMDTCTLNRHDVWLHNFKGVLLCTTLVVLQWNSLTLIFLASSPLNSLLQHEKHSGKVRQNHISFRSFYIKRIPRRVA